MNGKAALAALLALSLTLVPVSAHTIDADLTTEGSFVLTQAGTTDDRWHDSLENLGVPVKVQDSLTFEWSVNNGSGPAILFDIHSHAHGTETFYSSSASSDEGTWVAPGSELYLIAWENPNNESVTVDYAFGVHFAEADSELLLGVTLIVALAAGLWVPYSFVRRTRKEMARAKETEPPQEPPETSE